MSKKIRFAVVGLGHIGSRHVEMITNNESCELVAIVDVDESKRDKVEDDYQVRFFSSLDSLIHSDLNVDVINIATPNALHAEQSVKAIDSGCHVVLEKPISLSSVGCKEIVNASNSNDKHVFCVMQNRYSPPMQWLKDVVQKNLLGGIYAVNVNCYWNRDDRYYHKNTWHGTESIDGGTLYTQFSHYVDLVYWLFGDISNIDARFSNNNHKHSIDFEDSAMIMFDFLKGGSGSLSYTTSVWNKNMESTMVIIAENGTVKVGGQYMDKIEYCHIKDYKLPDDVNSSVEKRSARANHRFVIQNVVDVINGNNSIDTTVDEGAAVVDIIERIYALKK